MLLAQVGVGGTLVGAAAGLLLPLMIFLSRRSVTASKPGVANKLITTPERFLGPYLLPWQGQ